MKAKIRVGVLGCGYWGPLLTRNFKSLPECRLKVVCDPDIARVKHVCASYSDLEAVTDPQRLINASDLDAIVIATPVNTHYSLAKASLLAGKHTFIEKPMATSSRECEELIDIAERKGLILMVDHTFLYSAPVPGRSPKSCRPGFGRNPLHQFAPFESRIIPEGHQRRLGPRASRHFHHSAHSRRIARCD